MGVPEAGSELFLPPPKDPYSCQSSGSFSLMVALCGQDVSKGTSIIQIRLNLKKRQVDSKAPASFRNDVPHEAWATWRKSPHRVVTVALPWSLPGVALSYAWEGQLPVTSSSQLSARHLNSKSDGNVSYLELEFQWGNSRGEITLGQRD